MEDMKDRSRAYARYWRNSLVDAELGQGGLSRVDTSAFHILNRRHDVPVGRIDPDTVSALFLGEPDNVNSVEVVYRPEVYLAPLEHGRPRQDGTPEIITPLVTSADLTRDGRLCPRAGTFVPRDLLEPLVRGSYTIGTIEDLDAFLTADTVPGVDGADVTETAADLSTFAAQWKSHEAACARLLKQVCKEGSPGRGDLLLADYSYLVKKASVSGASVHILPLYDHMRQHLPSVPLFDRYANEAIDPAEACLPANSAFSMRLGHASDTYPLAPAQRSALTHLLATCPGEILGVNGPPGTGKTTMLLSVVASLWARAALDGGEPPVILAASTNNQAVTNIIDAFGKDFALGSGPLAGRWLPEIASFGAYFPARGKEAEAAAKYQTRGFFDRVESPAYVAHANTHYLAAAAQALPPGEAASVQSVVDGLQRRIHSERDKLVAVELAWTVLVQARVAVQAELGDDPQAAQGGRRSQVAAKVLEQGMLVELQEQWDSYLARESIFYALFAWLPPVARKRLRLARQHLKTVWPDGIAPRTWQGMDDIEAGLKALGEQCEQALQALVHCVEKGERVLHAEQQALAAWAAVLVPLGLSADPATVDLMTADEHADKVVRFPIFQLATHYWEGRWLLDMETLLPTIDKEKKKNGRIALEARWRRRMKLTPCVVSTFFMLPSEMKVSRHTGTDYVPDYLYDFADLLVVDEAGQVLPEVAGASFALAKKALVIGDTLQIEPIWSIPARVDIGNLVGAELLCGSEHLDEDYERLSDAGKSAASGSVMRIAQTASRWHQDADLARGLFLFEHRRCFDEIIGYCNTLCYHGKLQPMRGTKAAAIGSSNPPKVDRLPALAYLHVDGICRQRSDGSRENQLEAEVIAAWLAANRSNLEQAYGEPLHKIVGVVTPFGAQVQAIVDACRDKGISAGGQEGGMTVGTVHSLQGAERPVVIFSTVYSKHADGGFIDKNASMLNVAVSRAKNTFLVFGDIDLLGSVSENKPRGLLASMLLKDDENALQFEHQPRRDLAVAGTGLSQLRDAPEHDAFLQEVLSTATREVHIVTPWIRLGCVEETGAMEAMAAAIHRGVRVHVYTDLESNTTDRDPARKARKLQELQGTVQQLHSRGIEPLMVRKVHSKIVISDDNVYCVGSFNWFSARRDAKGARHETSLTYRGPNLVEEVEAMKKSLAHRILPQRS